MNPWEKTQKRVELPVHKRLYQADKQDLETLTHFLNEPKVQMYYEPNDETDYAVHNADGSISRVSECITINGTQWLLFPGINYVPKSVYEFIQQCPEQRHRVAAPMNNTCFAYL